MGKSASLREKKNWRGNGSTQEDNHLNGVTVDSLCQWIDVVCEGRRFGHGDGTVGRGERCARFQHVIILGHQNSHLRLKFEGILDRSTKYEMMPGDTTGANSR